jgi:2'-5' RNA ligase
VSREKRHRLFFALEPDAAVRRQVTEFQQSINIPGRAVPPPNLHVTLAFLGMQESHVIATAGEVGAALSFPRCEVVLDSPGRFKRAGVLWLGASRIPDALSTFQHELVDGLLKAGIGYDKKPWKFHLTLYRKMRNHAPIMQAVAIRWRLNAFSLVESVSVRSGVEYHTLGRWKGRDLTPFPGDL